MRERLSAVASGQSDIARRPGVVATDTAPAETDAGALEGSRSVPDRRSGGHR